MSRYAFTFMIGLALLLSSSPSFSHKDIDKVMKVQKSTQKAAVLSQDKIDKLVDERQSLLSQYRQVLLEVDSHEKYNDQVARLVSGQKKELLSLQRQLEEFEVTQRDIVPMMLRMKDSLIKLVHLDVPFLAQERKNRIDALIQLLDDPIASIPEKYRRLMEAYQIEAQYGRTIEAARQNISLDGGARMVDTLRIGRLGFYYMTLDGNEAGYWNKGTGKWVALPKSLMKDIAKGLRIARKQATPQLIKLYVPTAGGDS